MGDHGVGALPGAKHPRPLLCADCKGDGDDGEHGDDEEDGDDDGITHVCLHQGDLQRVAPGGAQPQALPRLQEASRSLLGSQTTTRNAKSSFKREVFL